MNDIGIDVSKKVSKPINKDKTDETDVIVSMVDRSKLPQYLQNSDKLILWTIEDPKNMDYEGHVKIRDMIYEKVKMLVKDLVK
ncbi:MAG: hypothetical protein BK997_01755 [Candidatus Micrarchaeum sp. ARMAN-1]|jgi:protein-tyrosine-phosphatase|nr:MAG: hypothetical protein BK997_01755 [Candidatus Micrarchaeum sp. ARMAN-1]